MRKITVNKPSLFIIAEGNEPMPIGEAIEVEMLDDHSEDDHEELLNRMHTASEIEINFTPDYYFNQKVITELFFGTTNNYRRMHGGFALRERNKYRWHKRNAKREYSK